MPVNFTLCPACQMIKNKQFEGKVTILNVPEKLSEELVNLIKGFCERAYSRDPINPRLKTHKLNGRFNKYWSFSIDYRNRIIFEFYRKGVVRFHSIGDHSIYK